MKKLVALLLVALLCMGLCTTVSAQSAIKSLDSRCSVAAGGSCDLEMTMLLYLDEGAKPAFPIPAEATDVTLNGQRGSVTLSGENKLLSLSGITGGNAGTYEMRIHYSLPGVVDAGQEGLILTLPLLSGFEYPVEELRFSVTLPSQVTTEPVFTSSYYQELIAAQLDVSVQGNTLTGQTHSLKDHETLSMQLPVTDEMFPQLAVTVRVMGVMDVVVLAFAALTLLYFLLTMRPKRLHREQRTTAPDGVSAGDLQMWFTGKGVDFSLLVVTWAQLGYLRIQVDRYGHVQLHKRMEMGNERSKFENRCFRNLFGARQTVDGSGYRYARLCREIWGKAPGIKEIYLPRSGNPKILRTLGMISGMLSGFLLATSFTPHSLLLKLLLALVCAALSYGLQAAGNAMFHRKKLPVLIGIGCCVIWMLLGIFSDDVVLSLLMVLFQFIVGLGAAYGGRRTLLGQQTMEQIFNLRRHILFGSKQDMAQLLRGNPNYFYELLPYALAMGLDRTFARHFDRLELQECNYLILSSQRQRTASEWAKVLRNTVESLDAKATRLPLERFKRK